MKKFNLILLGFICSVVSYSQTVATFENLTLSPDSYWDGSDLTGGFAGGNAYFVNDYDTTYFAWSGFTYSNRTDDTTAGWGNQYSAITGSGYANSANYVVADEYGNAKVRLTGAATGKLVKGFYVTNNAYAYYSMRDGDAFSKQFGGPNGTDEDWFKLTAKGWLNGVEKTEQAEFYLADFRSADSTQDYIVNDWRWFNLQPLGNVDSIQFYLSSSDTGQFGMNTPAYFCVDNFTTADELNVAPVTANDAAVTNYNTTVLVDVLANDMDVTATPLTVTLVDSGLIAGSAAWIDTNNMLNYTPASGIVATDTLSYQVCDDAGLCATAKVAIQVTGITGIDALTADMINVFPNPFSNNITINGSNAFVAIQLLDLNGRLVSNITTQANVSSTTINAANVSAGTYLLKVVTADTISYKKIVKQ